MLAACADNTSLRKMERQTADECQDDSQCPAGFVCREAACVEADPNETAFRPLEDRSNESLYRRLGSVDFGDGRGESGKFHLTVGVGTSRRMEVEDDLISGSLRARFNTGLKARLWAASFKAKGGEVTVNATSSDPERRFILKNITVESTNESGFTLRDAGFPNTDGKATLDLVVSADLGATEEETVRMTAVLEEVPVHVEFFVRDSHLVAKLAVAETRTLFGVPDGLSVEAIAIEIEVTGAELPKEWL